MLVDKIKVIANTFSNFTMYDDEGNRIYTVATVDPRVYGRAGGVVSVPGGNAYLENLNAMTIPFTYKGTTINAVLGISGVWDNTPWFASGAIRYNRTGYTTPSVFLYGSTYSMINWAGQNNVNIESSYEANGESKSWFTLTFDTPINISRMEGSQHCVNVNYFTAAPYNTTKHKYIAYLNDAIVYESNWIGVNSGTLVYSNFYYLDSVSLLPKMTIPITAAVGDTPIVRAHAGTKVMWGGDYVVPEPPLTDDFSAIASTWLYGANAKQNNHVVATTRNSSNYLYVSHDSGDTWSKITKPSNISMYAVATGMGNNRYTVSPYVGYFVTVGADGFGFISKDYGDTWEQFEIPYSYVEGDPDPDFFCIASSYSGFFTLYHGSTKGYYMPYTSNVWTEVIVSSYVEYWRSITSRVYSFVCTADDTDALLIAQHDVSDVNYTWPLPSIGSWISGYSNSYAGNAVALLNQNTLCNINHYNNYGINSTLTLPTTNTWVASFPIGNANVMLFAVDGSYAVIRYMTSDITVYPSPIPGIVLTGVCSTPKGFVACSSTHDLRITSKMYWGAPGLV